VDLRDTDRARSAECPVSGHAIPLVETTVIWRPEFVVISIGKDEKNLRVPRIFFGSQGRRFEEVAVITNCTANEGFEISPRFRRTIEERIARLEKDAAYDEAQLDLLEDADHIRRQMWLVAMQRSEALRMRLFLDRSQMRVPRPLFRL
jgi:hypothetical protein